MTYYSTKALYRDYLVTCIADGNVLAIVIFALMVVGSVLGLVASLLKLINYFKK